MAGVAWWPVWDTLHHSRPADESPDRGWGSLTSPVGARGPGRSMVGKAGREPRDHGMADTIYLEKHDYVVMWLADAGMRIGRYVLRYLS